MPGTPCFTDTNFGAVLCPLNPSQPLRVEGSAGNDRLSIFNNEVPESKPIALHGNAGNDELEDAFGGSAGRVMAGGPGNDVIKGHHGNDSIDGGDGNDTVDGDDQVRGGAGDDVMWGDHYGPGADLLDGQPRVDVTLDGVANDGRPGEGDNVVGIERLDMYISDAAVVDAIDVVANCETVDAANAPAPGGGVTAKVTRTSLRTLAKKGMKVAVACPAACDVPGSLLVGGKKVGGGRAKGSGTVPVKLKLDGKGKRRVKRLRKATLTVRLAVKAGGATETVSRSVKLKR